MLDAKLKKKADEIFESITLAHFTASEIMAILAEVTERCSVFADYVEWAYQSEDDKLA